ncbi:MAG: NUDIX domain-containing protein [Cyclobacteriaceae bacterium]|jgi:ADP-ribose pyrophosphatase YjhB (NUDIX family)|nr:NUDIX domain-containing protein [Cyclobacteriaceae bacterium]
MRKSGSTEVFTSLDDFYQRGDQVYLPHLSVDCAIFGFHENQLRVLLLKWKGGKWCLPGGFIKHKESVDTAAHRILQERTGLTDLYLKQFYVFGDPKREKEKKNSPHWIGKRFISIGYYALVEFSKVQPHPDVFSEACEWFDIDEVPGLIYDHKAIMMKALEALRFDLNDHPVGLNLLPKKFTMPELQRLYETILGESIDRRNFQKHMLSMDILIRLEERKTGGAHKAPYLYQFDKRKYMLALRQGLKLGW